MATHRPFSRGKPRPKPWLARRRRDHVVYMLGYHTTKDQAEQTEREFDEHWPYIGHNKGKRWNGTAYE